MPEIRTLESVYAQLTEQFTGDMARDVSEYGFTQAEIVDFAHDLLTTRSARVDNKRLTVIDIAEVENVVVEMIILGVEWLRTRGGSRG